MGQLSRPVIQGPTQRYGAVRPHFHSATRIALHSPILSYRRLHHIINHTPNHFHALGRSSSRPILAAAPGQEPPEPADLQHFPGHLPGDVEVEDLVEVVELGLNMPGQGTVPLLNSLFGLPLED